MSLFLVSYTEKAIAVFGEISKYENALLKLGGKFNPNLNYQGERKPGFIFPKTKSTIVSSFVQNPVEVPKQIVKEESKTYKINTGGEEREKNVKEAEHKDNKDVIMLSREQFLTLVNTLNRLEQDVAYLKKVVNTQSIESNKTNDNIECITIPVEKITSRAKKFDGKKTEKKMEEKETVEEKTWADEMSDNSESYSDNFDEEIELPKLLKPKVVNSVKETVKKNNTKPQSLLLKSLTSDKGNK